MQESTSPRNQASMTTPGTGRSPDSNWHKLYEAAILELDLAKLSSRIEKAKKAIYTRIVELASSDQKSEWQPLMDARNVLDDLLRMQKARLSEPHKAEH